MWLVFFDVVDMIVFSMCIAYGCHANPMGVDDGVSIAHDIVIVVVGVIGIVIVIGL